MKFLRSCCEFPYTALSSGDNDGKMKTKWVTRVYGICIQETAGRCDTY